MRTYAKEMQCHVCRKFVVMHKVKKAKKVKKVKRKCLGNVIMRLRNGRYAARPLKDRAAPSGFLMLMKASYIDISTPIDSLHLT